MTGNKQSRAIVFLTKDLMIQSNASATAKRLTVPMVAAGNIESAIKKISEHSAVGLLVDLQTPGLVTSELIAQLQQSDLEFKTFAFAQHVETELLDSANSGIFEAVLTRGQFNNRLPKIIEQLVVEHNESAP